MKSFFLVLLACLVATNSWASHGSGQLHPVPVVRPPHPTPVVRPPHCGGGHNPPRVTRTVVRTRTVNYSQSSYRNSWSGRSNPVKAYVAADHRNYDLYYPDYSSSYRLPSVAGASSYRSSAPVRTKAVVRNNQLPSSAQIDIDEADVGRKNEALNAFLGDNKKLVGVKTDRTETGIRLIVVYQAK